MSAIDGDGLCMRVGCVQPMGHDGACVDGRGNVLLSKRSYGHSQPRRTPEAQADIAAARGVPIDALDPLRVPEQSGPPIEAVLSNAALADTPAVREMGGPAGCAHSMFTPGCRACAVDPRCCSRPMNPMPNGTLWCDTCGTSRVVNLPPDAIVLTGPEAERYRAITAAARKAQASAATARADSAALLQLFQAFCAGLAPGKEG